MHTDARGLENAYLIGRWTWGFRKASKFGGMILKKRGRKMEDDVRGDKLFSFFFSLVLYPLVFIERKQRVVELRETIIDLIGTFFFLTRHPLVLFAAQSVN